MRRSATLYLGAFAVFALLQAVSGRAQDPKDINGTWTAELHSARVFLQLRTSAPDGRSNGGRDGEWSTGQTMPADEFGGLPVADEHFTASTLKFELRREAGSFAFDGAFRDGRGAGLFVFTPRVEFAAEMKAIGHADDLPIWRRYQLAVHDVGPKYIRTLKAEGYDKLTLDEIQRGRTHGVTVDYIRDLKALGYRNMGWEALVRTRDHGVTGDYIKAMRAAGYADLPLDDLVRTKDHGVTPAYVDDMRRAGFKDVPLVELVHAKDH